MHTLSYQQLVNDATETLSVISDSPRIDAEVLLLHTVQRPLSWLIAYGDGLASPDHVKQFYAFLAQRIEHRPIAYIIGKKEFWSLSLNVNEHVLVPRADTETLVKCALEKIPKEIECNIADLGTGSGAIALSIAKERPKSRVSAIDLSQTALDLAAKNAQSNGIQNVAFRHGDWFSALSDETFDVIVSNPPYVQANDPHLQQGDLVHEPEMALIGGGDGLDDIRTIICGATQHLKPHGWLLLEHGSNQAQEVIQLLEAANFRFASTSRDLNNLPRCTSAQRSLT